MKKFFNIELLISFVALVVMISVVVIQVVFRYLGTPFAWPEEIARWMLIWITFAGAGYCFRNGGLIRVDYFVKKLFSTKTQLKIDIGGIFVMILFFGYLLYSACMYSIMLLQREQMYPITKLPFIFIVAALIVGSILTIIFSIQHITQKVQEIKAIKKEEGVL